MRRVRLIGCFGIFEGIELEVEKEITMGRNAGLCQLVYPETARGISGAHCKIENTEEGVFLTDLHSTNGTFLADGTRLVPDKPLPLLDGQGFCLGGRGNAFDVLIG
ncbi:MAG: FHA domain-containing protein [Blautia sp.]|nr:FHA domain-containing protein [Blautia sp.]MCM1201212.1 FHA domain-containing protein [Bacteroides fragilis]